MKPLDFMQRGFEAAGKLDLLKELQDIVNTNQTVEIKQSLLQNWLTRSGEQLLVPFKK